MRERTEQSEGQEDKIRETKNGKERKFKVKRMTENERGRRENMKVRE